MKNKQLPFNYEFHKQNKKGVFHMPDDEYLREKELYNKVFYKDRHNFKLPLEAIDTLIYSYGRNILSAYEEMIYQNTESSCGRGFLLHGNYMLEQLIKELDRIGMDGKRFVWETHDHYFKEDCDKMKAFSEKHSDKDGKRIECDNPDCCCHL